MAISYPGWPAKPGAGAQRGSKAGVTQSVLDLAAAYRRSLAAAETYNRLRHMSDEALAAEGLTRDEIPKAVLAVLTESGGGD